MQAAIELQKAIFQTLKADAGLAAIMGEVRIYDHAPANAKFPYVTFGRASIFDWGTDTDDGTEHVLTLHAWSKARGKAEALAIAGAIEARLHDAAIEIGGHALTLIRREAIEIRYEDDVDVHHGLIRLRALVEAA